MVFTPLLNPGTAVYQLLNEYTTNDLHLHPGSKKTYDWTIILGGTKLVPYSPPHCPPLTCEYSDIAYAIPPAQIFAALKGIYDIALSKEHKVLALTVPECEAKGERGTQSRHELNQMILNNKGTN
jgi:hypothetical protein